MKTYKQYHVLLAIFCFWSITLYSQNENFDFYIKFQPDLEFKDLNEVISKTNLRSLKTKHTFTVHRAYTLTDEQIETLSKKSKTGFTLKNTFRVSGTFSEEESNKFLKGLEQFSNIIYVEKVSKTPIKPPHDIAPITSNYEANQGYLEVNPGLNIRHAWNAGFTGNGINIKDVEYGLNVNHEELDHQNASIIAGRTINSGASEAFTEHGTAVGGIVFSDNGSYGITGIAHGANEYVLHPEWTEEFGYNRTLAISEAIANSNAGDIIIYEMQEFGQNSNFVPAEYLQTVWDLTKSATDAGIIIIAAAGNGNENLDSAFYNSYMARGDSGAIIVGAGSSNLSHSPMSFSTYGSRVNVHAWGQNVWSTGKYGGSILVGNDFNQSYYSSFSGTSSATAIIGGFAAVLQSYYYNQTSGSYLNASQMRSIMVQTGIPQGSGKPIGPMPYMSAAMNEVDQILSSDSFQLSSFSVSPNPSKGKVFINFSQSPTFTNKIEIHNILGQSILNTFSKEKTVKIDLSNLQKGIYMVKVSSNKDSTVKKLIIN